ncbi:hypothetical protein D3C86_1279590 [compost metagenome]
MGLLRTSLSLMSIWLFATLTLQRVHRWLNGLGRLAITWGIPITHPLAPMICFGALILIRRFALKANQAPPSTPTLKCSAYCEPAPAIWT